MSNQLIFIALALLAGGMIPFQSAMNAQLGKSLQSPYFSTLVIFLVALVGLGIFILLSRSQAPTADHFAQAPKWSYIGGLLGGSYVLLIVVCAPKLGIGNVTVMVLLGQILAAMIIDQFGLLNTLKHAITWPRFLGVVLMIAGVYLVKRF